MPYTTQRNRVNGPNGQVIVKKKQITVFFKPNGERAVLPVSARKLLSLPISTGLTENVRLTGIIACCEKNPKYLPIAKGDSAVRLYLEKPIDGSCDLMIVSRRGLRRAACKALRARIQK